MTQNSSAGTARRSGGLRGGAFAAVILMLVEYGLGTWAARYARLPASDAGKGMLAAFGGAVTDGPAAVAAHAVLGTALVAAAIGVLVRAARVRAAVPIVLGVVALAALVVAWLSGARFAGGGDDGASFAMAIATGIALLGYATIMFLPDRSNP